MRAKRLILTTFLVLGVGYVAYPYATLYRLNVAIRQADAATLRSVVDWYAVREGLKEDLCDMVLDEPSNSRPADQLAPFGESFVHGMTSNAVDQAFTPETLVSLNHGDEHPWPEAHLAWAFFRDPTHFLVEVRVATGVVRMEMELRDDMRWRIRRVHLPNEMLEGPLSTPVVAQAER